MYRALYRKYRPASFDDVISQPHITETLKKEIATDRTSHAYIFTGSRGTGKTTCARILAKAMVCEHPKNGEPCLECDICRDMDRESLSDVIEIDAASYGGVDDARELREAASYTPERCRYRIYIIDEVHMLSPSAFNALLKLIEEPPPHIRFIMATTEIHKVIPTILSRCQRFDFKRIRPEDIAKRLIYVAGKENLSLDEEAAMLIARASDGGMRDALSLLDRCIAFSDEVTPETVTEAAGITGSKASVDMTEALLSGNVTEALRLISDAYSSSKDMALFFTEIMRQLRNVLIIKNVPEPGDLLTSMPHETERLKSIADNTDEKKVLFALDELGKRTERFTGVSDKRTELEMAAIRICKGEPDSISVNKGYEEKLERLENTVNSLKASGYSASAPSAPEPRSARSRMAPKETVTDLSGVNNSNIKPLMQWADILEKFGKVCPAMNGTLHGSQGYESGDILLIVTDNSFFLQLLRMKENAMLLRKTICEVTGKNYIIRARCTAPKAEGTDTENDKLDALLNKAAGQNIHVEYE